MKTLTLLLFVAAIGCARARAQCRVSSAHAPATPAESVAPEPPSER